MNILTHPSNVIHYYNIVKAIIEEKISNFLNHLYKHHTQIEHEIYIILSN